MAYPPPRRITRPSAMESVWIRKRKMRSHACCKLKRPHSWGGAAIAANNGRHLALPIIQTAVAGPRIGPEIRDGIRICLRRQIEIAGYDRTVLASEDTRNRTAAARTANPKLDPHPPTIGYASHCRAGTGVRRRSSRTVSRLWRPSWLDLDSSTMIRRRHRRRP